LTVQGPDTFLAKLKRSADEKKQIEDARRFDLPAPDFTKPFTKTDAKGEPIPDPFANDGLLPLVPPSLYVPPSHVLDFPADPDLPPELQVRFASFFPIPNTVYRPSLIVYRAVRP
jgi:hypothetical protein